MTTYIDDQAKQWGYPDLATWIEHVRAGDKQALEYLVVADFDPPRQALSSQAIAFIKAFETGDRDFLAPYLEGDRLTSEGTNALLDAWERRDRAST